MNRTECINTLMDCVNYIMKDLAENIDENDDYIDYITTKDINKLVLVATVNEFIVIDRDKFQTLEISKNNRFRI